MITTASIVHILLNITRHIITRRAITAHRVITILRDITVLRSFITHQTDITAHQKAIIMLIITAHRQEKHQLKISKKSMSF